MDEEQRNAQEVVAFLQAIPPDRELLSYSFKKDESTGLCSWQYRYKENYQYTSDIVTRSAQLTLKPEYRTKTLLDINELDATLFTHPMGTRITMEVRLHARGRQKICKMIGGIVLGYAWMNTLYKFVQYGYRADESLFKALFE